MFLAVFRIVRIPVSGVHIGRNHGVGRAAGVGVRPFVRAAVSIGNTLLDAEGEPFLGFRVEVGAHGVAVVVRHASQALLLHVRCGNEVSGVSGTSLHGEVSVVHRSCVVKEVLLPVGVGTVQLVLFIFVGLDDAVLQLELEQFVGVHRVADAVGQLAPTNALRNGDAGLFVGTSALGGHINNTVGCTRTVDRSGRSVLQRGDAFDVAVVEQGEHSGRGGSTVDHHKGFTACTERTHTTQGDAHVAHFASVAGVGENLQTSHLTLQSVSHVGSGFVGYLFAAHLLHGTYHGTDFTCRTVTNHNGLAEFVVLEHNLHVAGNANRFGLHTDIRNHEFLGTRRHIQLERTLCIGGGNDFRAGDAHSGTHDRLAV